MGSPPSETRVPSRAPRLAPPLLLLLLGLLCARAQDDFDLSHALGGDDSQSIARPSKKPLPGDDLNLEDAFSDRGHVDPPAPNPPKPKPDPRPHQPGTSGGFSDSDLQDVAADGAAGGSGDPGRNRKDAGGKQGDQTGVISGVVGALLVAVGGALSSAFAYQRRKWCFKEQDPESVNMEAQQQSQGEPTVQRTLLEK